MKIGTWTVLTLFGASLLSGCYGSSGQTKDGQSHWLRECSQPSECDDGELCACGVCTVECEASAACGAGAACERVDARDACGGAPAAVSKVCLTACSRAADCAGSGLSCDDGACVGAAATGSPFDAAVTGGDAAVPGRDGGVRDAQVGFDTIEGALTCAEVAQRHSAFVADLSSAQQTCETERDCTCASVSTRCQSLCERPVSRFELDAIAQSIATFDDSYCADPDLPDACAGQFSFDVDCTPPCAAAACVAGQCQSVDRDPCDAVLACGGDLLCHIDQTCIARNAPDDNGIATLAVARELGDRGPSFPGIPAFVVTDDAVIWLDAGTFDGTGTHNHDATVYRMGLDDDAPEILAQDLAAGVAGMAFDAANVYFTTVDGIWSVPRDGSARPFHLVERLEAEQSQWVLDGGYVWYVNTARDGFLHRVTVDGSEDVVAWNMADPLRGLAAYGGHVYEELYNPGDPGSDSMLIEIAELDQPATITNNFRAESDTGPLLVSGSVLLADVGERNGVQAYDFESGRFYTLAGEAWLDQRSATDTHVYYVESADSGVSDMPDYFIGRTAIGTDESERLRHATGPVGHVLAAGDFLYWVEDRRLLRKPL